MHIWRTTSAARVSQISSNSFASYHREFPHYFETFDAADNRKVYRPLLGLKYTA